MNNRELVIGVTGGIAAYKTAMLVSQLVQQGAQVSVVMTQAAEKFIGPATFAALTGRPVFGVTFDARHYALGPHIELAERGELLCVAPATANFIAKAAHGIADDLLSTLYLSFAGPILVAPAMKNDMWAKASVQRNVDQLRRDGVHMVGPDEGWLSCRKRGMGRMSPPETIAQTILEHLCLES